MNCAPAGWCGPAMSASWRARSARRSHLTLPLMKRWAHGRANSPNSCFRRKALPKLSAGSIRRCSRAIIDLSRVCQTFHALRSTVMSSLPASEMPVIETRPFARAAFAQPGAVSDPIPVLIVVPSLDAGAADVGAVGLTRVLTAAGHRAIVASRAGRLVADITAAGGEFVPLDLSSTNPVVMLRNAGVLIRIARERNCDVIHALGRAAAWSAWLAARLRGIPFVTSWYKGFRDQNILKHAYNGIMARGDRVVALSEQIATLINDRYGTPWERIAVLPPSIDFARFNPAAVSRERIETMRATWGVQPDTKVILITGRILRRKGHHVVVKAAKRLKEMG